MEIPSEKILHAETAIDSALEVSNGTLLSNTREQQVIPEQKDGYLEKGNSKDPDYLELNKQQELSDQFNKAIQESHRASASRLLDTMEINVLLAGTIESMLQLELSKNPALQPFENTIRDFFNKYMSGESLRDAFIDIYVETFTENELNELNAFYSTPTGQKTLKETPALLAKGARIGEQRVQENIPELKLMIQEESKRIQALQQNAE